MSRQSPTSKETSRPSREARRGELFRELRLLGAGVLLLLLLAALFAYDPARPAGGLAGTVGHFLARWTFRGLGLTSFLLIPLTLYWLGLMFFRREGERSWERPAGLALVTMAMAAGLALTVETSRRPALADGGPGGELGGFLRTGLAAAFGPLGAFLVVLVAFLFGLALLTDWLIYEMVVEALRTFRVLGPWGKKLLWPEPAAQAAAASAASAAAVLPAPLPRADEAPASRRAGKEPDCAAAEKSAPPAAETPPVPPSNPAPDLRGAEKPDDPSPAAPRRRAPRKAVAAKDADGDYEFPPLDLLDKPRVREVRAEEETIQRNARVLEQTLTDFKIDAQVVGYTRGPVVTMYELSLAAGTKVTRIHSLADDLAMSLKAQTVRVVAPIPGKSTVGVEVPNPARDDVRMRGLLETDTFRRSKAAIPILLGVDAGGSHLVEDLSAMPHFLIAGATGSGKSVCINSIIMSVLMTRTPGDVKLILVDPKQVELSFFSRIPHLLSPVVTDMKRATSVLEWAVEKMDERYDLLARMEVRSITSYNELGVPKIRSRMEEQGIEDIDVPTHLPYIVIVVDELADLMMTAGKDIEVLITRLAQKSRAVGIHVVLATQRPSTDVITGLIKANMPTRVCFKVTSKVDSRVVLDQNGGDRLLGAGDMLYLPPRTANLLRGQGTFVSDAEVKRVVEFLAERHPPQFNRELTQVCTGALLADGEKDEIYDEAVRVVLEEQRGSASLLQRALEIGYTRASRLLDLMRKEGIVGAYKGSKASEVLCTLEEYEARKASAAAQDAGDGGDAGAGGDSEEGD